MGSPSGTHYILSDRPTWDTLGHSHLGIPMLVPIGTHLYFHIGHTWAFPLGQSQVGPNWDPSLFSYGTHLVILTWAFPCWSQLGLIFIFTWDTPGHSHFGIPMYDVGPNWDPSLFSYGTQVSTPTWAFPCTSQLRPTFIFTWDTSGYSHMSRRCH